ncbi:MAG: hypothetical protein R3F53_10475 [Gammaproteobacteria bacterium]
MRYAPVHRPARCIASIAFATNCHPVCFIIPAISSAWPKRSRWRTLGRLPQQLLVYGIVGADFSHGEGLCAPVARSVERLAEQLRAKFVYDTLADFSSNKG